MTEIFVGSSLAHPETKKMASSIAVIGFAGAFAGGSNNSQYKDSLSSRFGSENTFIVPSVSTKFAFHDEPRLSSKTYRNNEYYRTLASSAIDRFPNRDTFLIHCHSGGGIEGLAFTKAALENNKLRTKKIKLLFSGVPGFSETKTSQVGRAFDLLKNYISMGIHRADIQHFDLCPPPEEYFSYSKNNQPEIRTEQKPTVDIVYKDTPTTREQRRKTFYNKYMSFLTPHERQMATTEINALDNSIKEALADKNKTNTKQLNKLMHERANVVFSIGGDRYYNEYLANKPEFKNIPSNGLDGTLVGALYLIRLLSSAGKGMEKKLADVIQLAKKRSVNIDFSFGLFEKDDFISQTDIPSTTSRLTQAGVLDSLASWLVIEGLSHESVDNSPQGILSAIVKLSEK